MRRLLGTATTILATGVLWWLLAGWVPGGSERFYLLLPPAALLLAVVWMPGGVGALKAYRRKACGYVVGLLGLVTAYGLYLSFLLAPAAEVAVWQRVRLQEVLLGAWFLLGIKIVLTPPYVGVRRAVRWLDDRLLGPRGAERPARPGHGLAPQVLPTLLLALPILAYALATLYVHRLKVPNLTTPQSELLRAYEEVEFQTADGLTIRGWFIPCRQRDSQRTLLFCHGLGANRPNFLPFVRVGDGLNAHVLMFDFRGHGESDGHTVTFGHAERRDVLAAVDYLRRQRPEQCRELFGMGVSMGTSALIAAAAEVEPPFDGLILDSAFASATELTEHILRLFPPVLRPGLATIGIPLASLEAGCWLPDVRPIEQIDQVRTPLLFVHSDNDTLIPVDHGQRLFARARPPKEIVITRNTGHGGALAAYGEYLEAVIRLSRLRNGHRNELPSPEK